MIDLEKGDRVRTCSRNLWTTEIVEKGNMIGTVVKTWPDGRVKVLWDSGSAHVHNSAQLMFWE